MHESHRDFEPVGRIAEMKGLILEQIRKLAELHEEGIPTDEEFTAKKQELLSRF